MSDTAIAASGVRAVADTIGIKLDTDELEIVAQALIGILEVFASASQKRASLAGQAAAAKITNAEEAEAAAAARK